MGMADYKDRLAEEREAKDKLEASQRKKQLAALEKELELAAQRVAENRLSYYVPYPKQLDFHAAGNTFKQRLLMAGNQTGKTWCGGAEYAMHLTGRYPKDWPGFVFNRPVRGWAAGVTSETTRDIVQRVLIGTKADGWGTGMIPKDCLSKDKMTLARGISDLYDTILVKHVTGQWSELKLKSYERGQEKWQGDTLDLLWFDEEPPGDVYSEGYTRTVVKNGLIMVTFTPLQGMSEVVTSYLNNPTADQHVTMMGIEDAQHIPAERRAAIVAGYPEHEREARSKGVPMLGSGAVFNVAESAITCDPFSIPDHWSLLWGMDFGVEHPFAAVLVAWNRDADVMYVIHTIRLKNSTPLQHAETLRAALMGRGGLVPVAWPHDVNQRKEFEGALVPLKTIYKKYGLNMHEKHAQFIDGTNSTEVGILLMQERLSSGRLKVFSTCADWFGEYRMYHRKDGVIHKVNDDLLSATRMAVMMQRIARVVTFDARTAEKKTLLAKDIDLDPWAR